MIVLNYAKLFSIEFLHNAYRDVDDILRDINIMPDQDTYRILNGRRLFYKFERNTLFCFVQTRASVDTLGGTLNVTTENKPLIQFDESEFLSFIITLNSGNFLNSSNLRLYNLNQKTFRFGNDSGNKQNTEFYLSKKIPAYDAAQSYIPGMLVTDATLHTFEAILNNGPANVHNTTENQFWKAIAETDQYVNQADLINTPGNDRCFAVIKISFLKNLANQFSFLKKSNIPAEDNKILGKDYIIHFKNNEIN